MDLSQMQANTVRTHGLWLSLHKVLSKIKVLQASSCGLSTNSIVDHLHKLKLPSPRFIHSNPSQQLSDLLEIFSATGIPNAFSYLFNLQALNLHLTKTTTICLHHIFYQYLFYKQVYKVSKLEQSVAHE